VRITLNAKRTLEQSAALHFERAKKARRKADGARKALEITRSKMAAQELLREDAVQRSVPKAQRKRDWYERLRWFVSSDGVLCVGGRDAGTNELVVKRHAEAGDLVFHADMAGAPFVVAKARGAEVLATTRAQAAQFAATYSRAWKAGVSVVEVMCARPEQVSKTAQAGEFMGKGAFMIRGHVEHYSAPLGVVFGKEASGRVMAGPKDAVLAHCPLGIEVLQGNEKASDVAKRIGKRLDAHPDEIIPLLPPGGVKMGRELKPPSA
jgi:predicted ribosome quality control (RQC) complex YloA/Tae2 family protein